MQSEPQTTDPALFVPDEPGVYWCARHRKVKTRLRCGRCERPICPKCTVMGPTGARCPDCASNRTSHIYQVKPWQFLVSFLAAAIFGMVGAVLVSLAGMLIFWALLYAPVAGPMLGKAISRITGGKRGPVLASVVSAGLVCGAVTEFVGGGFLQWSMMQRSLAFANPQTVAHAHLQLSFPEYLLLNPFGAVFVVVFLVVAIGGTWWWLR